mmetsp:Transcript_72491/g.170481  ORF Transcript_72491/g.170481 Transcript_72491/m.170481 type:complete len:226 (-) Transcript_72491:621-1298(-)
MRGWLDACTSAGVLRTGVMVDQGALSALPPASSMLAMATKGCGPGLVRAECSSSSWSRTGFCPCGVGFAWISDTLRICCASCSDAIISSWVLLKGRVGRTSSFWTRSLLRWVTMVRGLSSSWKYGRVSRMSFTGVPSLDPENSVELTRGPPDGDLAPAGNSKACLGERMKLGDLSMVGTRPTLASVRVFPFCMSASAVLHVRLLLACCEPGGVSGRVGVAPFSVF